MRKSYNKLIRDRIPEIMDEEGVEYAVAVMADAEYREALLEKLLEEAQEVKHASADDVVKELADLQEVVAALIQVLDITPEQVSEIQARRQQERGGFGKKLKLLWTNR